MLRRAGTTNKKHILYYSLRVFKFADLENIIFEISEILIEFAISNRLLDFAFLFSSTSKHSRAMLWKTVGEQPTSIPVSLAPLKSSKIEMICWAFARCYFCFKESTHSNEVACLTNGRNVLICTCAHHNEQFEKKLVVYPKYTFKETSVVANLCMFPVAADLQQVFKNLQTAETLVQRCSVQAWQEISHGRLTITRLGEFDVAVRIGGRPQLNYKVTVGKRRAVFEKFSSEYLITHLLCKGRPSSMRSELIEALKQPELAVEPTNRRYENVPWKIAEKKCMHAFGTTNPFASIARCTLCMPQ